MGKKTKKRDSLQSPSESNGRQVKHGVEVERQHADNIGKFRIRTSSDSDGSKEGQREPKIEYARAQTRQLMGAGDKLI